MNSAVNYYSAAARHADAIREARRNPPLVFAPAPTDDAGPSLLARLARRRRLRLVFGL
jgi:hypothetical protein